MTPTSKPGGWRLILTIQAFIIASTATEEEMLRWFHEHVVWTDKPVNLKLLRKGILTRIYAPMAIIQGLRESGTFSSAIASAQSLSKDSFLSSMGDLHKNTSSVLTNSMSKESQATNRKILEIVDIFEKAVPPMSPPRLFDIHNGI